ncbi:hypothetical protein J4H86_24800 [Spiractinospora alimapuensis]|uniref:LVIVD repeat-containing protein n=1 Tax=Spiractinospora alimapuensis TaxID=2820884 RepID=UPI001F20CA68|nr:hypothetical protein [Spiractinospora alimapuensis]QVQ51926.1 hypothetical protein J4H86_24800 [Spiractinospora alimapuensis]
MAAQPRPFSRRHPHHRPHWFAAGVLATLVAVSLFAPPVSADAAPDEGHQDVEHSDNVNHLANLPKPEAFADDQSWNTDLAFSGDYAVAGNYEGFTIYDISSPEEPEIVSVVVCPGLQNDVSISGDLLYTSTDVPMESDECGAERAGYDEEWTWEGLRVFDISDKANPRYVSAVRTACGSHTHTLVPGDEETDYVYISSYMTSGEYVECGPTHDKISVVEIPKDDPAAAAVANEPVIFPDGGNTDQPGLLFPTSGCHDITIYRELDIAAGACMGDGVIMDISDPLEPEVLDQVQDENFAFWHSATFSNDASTVVFTDELGGGGAATCDEEHYPHLGANAFYSLSDRGGERELSFESYYKIPRHQEATENCVAHNGSLIPVPGRDFMVQAWYQGGVSVIDFNDVGNPKEIAYFDRSTYSDQLMLAGSWSAYWYNGHIYSSDIQNGLDVLEVTDPRLRSAQVVQYEEFNPQSQFRYRPNRTGPPD